MKNTSQCYWYILNSLRIWAMGRDEERYSVSHSEEITCFALTNDSQHVITGSKDMSLKVWQLAGGKLAQVLVGHTDHLSCIAANKDLVVSGSRDANLIVWDIKTGSDLHTLTAHLSYVTSVQISADGTLAVSGKIINLTFIFFINLYHTVFLVSLDTKF